MKGEECDVSRKVRNAKIALLKIPRNEVFLFECTPACPHPHRLFVGPFVIRKFQGKFQ